MTIMPDRSARRGAVSPGRQRRFRRRLGLNAGAVLLAGALALPVVVGIAPRPTALAAATAQPAAPAAQPITVRLTGRIVKVELSGFEPDFDPVDRVIIAATLRDTRPRAQSQALPDTMLVLSSYLENFKPDTTPVLPDVLHPDRTATSLGGFMQGKSALVNKAGRTAYRGSLLAEVFLDNSAHLVLDVERTGAGRATGVPDTAPALRLTGALTLYKDLTVRGDLRSERALSPADIAALRVAPGRLPSWQTVVSGMAIHLPAMMGTGGGGGSGVGTGAPGGAAHSIVAAPAHPKAPAAPANTTRFMAPTSRVLLGGAALIMLLVAMLLWRFALKATIQGQPDARWDVGSG